MLILYKISMGQPAGSKKFNSMEHTTIKREDLNNISTASLPLSLIQEEQLSGDML